MSRHRNPDDGQYDPALDDPPSREQEEADYLDELQQRLDQAQPLMKGPTPDQELEMYRAVMRRIEALMGAEPGTPEGIELDFLTTVAESVEERLFPLTSSHR